MTIKNTFQSKNDKADDIVLYLSELQEFSTARNTLLQRVVNFLAIQNQSYKTQTGSNMTTQELYQRLEDDEGISFIAKTIGLTEKELDMRTDLLNPEEVYNHDIK